MSDESILFRLESAGTEAPRLQLRALDDEEIAPTTSGADRYQVIGEIARGGVGVVHKARDVDLGRDVAVKVLRECHLDSPEVVQRFVEEAQVGGQLQHPGIVPVYELGLGKDRRPFFAMKLVKGETLAAVLDASRGRAEERRRVLAIFQRACRTVAYAHSRGVVHRDLKPANVMIGAFGEVQVVDWGFSKVLARGGVADERRSRLSRIDVTRIHTVRSKEGSGSDSVAGSVFGTPAYMPPEQALGRVDELDERSDVFALGAILCEILTGAPPYPLGTEEAFRMAARCELDDAHARLDACEADAELVALCRAALSPVPKDRPRNATALADAVREHLAAVDERAHRSRVQTIEDRERAARSRQQANDAREAAAQQRRKRSRTMRIAVAALVVLLVGGGVGIGLDRARRERVQGIVAAVEEALRETSRHRGAGNLDLAVAAAERAAELAAAPEAPDPVVNEASALLAAVSGEADAAREAAEQLERDAAFVADLEEIRLRRVEDFDSRRTDADYADAFRRHGIDVLGLTPAQAAEHIRARTDAVALAAALDDWAWLRLDKKKDLPEADARHLIEVARLADPDEWRNRLRAAVLRRDAAELHQLAAEADVQALPARTLDMLSLHVGDVEPRAAVALLRRACLEHQDDLWLSYHLHLFLRRLDPPDHEESLRYLTAAAALRPCARVFDALGDVLGRIARFEEQLACYRRQIALYPGHAMGYANLGSVLSNAFERHEQALEVIETAIRLDPELAMAHYNRGVVLRKLGRPTEAESAYRKVIELDPGYVRAHRGLGLVLCFELRRPGDAIEEFRKAIELDPRNTRLRRNLAHALRRLGDLSGSEKELRRAIDIDPDSALCYTDLGRTLSAQRRFEDAVFAFQSAIERDPHNAAIRISLGVLLCTKLGRLDEGARQYRAALDADPENAIALHNLGQIHVTKNERDKAIVAFRRAAQADPKYYSAHFNLAAELSLRGSVREAADAWERALPLAPNDEQRYYCRRNLATALHNRSMEQVHAGDYRGAVTSLRRAKELAPNDPDILNNLAVTYLTAPEESLRNPAEVLSLAKRAWELEPGNPDRVGLLGVALHLNARHEEAAKRLRESIPAYTEAKSANYDRVILAMALWKLGKREEARKTLRTAEAWFAENESDAPGIQRFRAMAKKMIEPK